jgi:hypothetical protein
VISDKIGSENTLNIEIVHRIYQQKSITIDVIDEFRSFHIKFSCTGSLKIFFPLNFFFTKFLKTRLAIEFK